MLIYGRNAVLEALRSGGVSQVLAAKGIEAAMLRELEGAAARAGVAVAMVPRIELDRALKTTNHQGVAAELPEVKTTSLAELVAAGRAAGGRLLLVLLDQLSDPRNLGAIVRSAEALGAHGLVMEERRSAPLSAVAVKASAGATSLLPIAVVTNLPRAIEQLKEQGVWVYGAAALDTDPTAADAASIDWDRDAALVIGSEGSGMRRLVRERCDGMVGIPMAGRIGSLNAAVAAGILLYVVQRGRAGHQPAT